jgi:hypothetical protein
VKKLGAEVLVRTDEAEVVIVAHTTAGSAEVARHLLSTSGRPRTDVAHYPGHPQQPDGAPRLPTLGHLLHYT